MVDFLSDQWIAALADACAAARADDTANPTGDDGRGDGLVIEPMVRSVPGRGVVRYRVAFTGASCAVAAPGSDDPPADVRIETDYPTAVALARGETNAQAALAAGRLRVLGDVARLAAHAGALARFDDLFSSVRATTSYPGA